MLPDEELACGPVVCGGSRSGCGWSCCRSRRRYCMHGWSWQGW